MKVQKVFSPLNIAIGFGIALAVIAGLYFSLITLAEATGGTKSIKYILLIGELIGTMFTCPLAILLTRFIRQESALWN